MVDALAARGGRDERSARPRYRGPRCDATPVNKVDRLGSWLVCTRFDTGLREPRLAVAIPPSFTEMLVRQPDAARAWRMASREIFLTYLSRATE